MCFGSSEKRAPLSRPGVTAIARASLFVNHAWLTNPNFFDFSEKKFGKKSRRRRSAPDPFFRDADRRLRGRIRDESCVECGPSFSFEPKQFIPPLGLEPRSFG